MRYYKKRKVYYYTMSIMYKVEFTEKLLEVSANKTVISLAIRQKGESQNRSYKKTKHTKFSEKLTFLHPYTHTFVCVSEGK